MKRTFIQFVQFEAFASILLLIATATAMILANTNCCSLNQYLKKQALFWINDGLMTIFFLLVGLEIKQSIAKGAFARWSYVALPILAALGGMVVPIIFYCLINMAHPIALNGWAIPVATDIAFALGLLSFFGSRVPHSLKLFLMALAIFDDLGAILLITLCYTDNLNGPFLLLSALLSGLLYGLNRLSIQKLSPYLIIGIGLWACLLQAGIHPTVAGVVLALMIPAQANPETSLVHRLESTLHPWVAYLIMPLFALANAGFSWEGINTDVFFSTITLGIACSLFFGKQIGVFVCSWLLIRLRWAVLPKHSSWGQLYGIALLCGIGFTMSLFLGTLSFEQNPRYITEVRLGVMLGSCLSAVIGMIVLSLALNKR